MIVFHTQPGAWIAAAKYGEKVGLAECNTAVCRLQILGRHMQEQGAAGSNHDRAVIVAKDNNQVI